MGSILIPLTTLPKTLLKKVPLLRGWQLSTDGGTLGRLTVNSVMGTIIFWHRLKPKIKHYQKITPTKKLYF